MGIRRRIILMYISEISGHHSATLAIEKALKMLAPQTEILNINAFNYTNPISEKIVNRIYMEVIKRTPKLWDYLYDNPKIVKSIEKMKDTIHKFNSPKLKNLFDRFNPDAVVCTQAFPCGMVADYKKTYNSSLPLIGVLTDYVPHSYWVYDAVDYYISPSEDVSLRLIKKGVAAGKIRALGIPFDPRFNETQDKYRLREKLKLSAEESVILIMGGGQGLGPIKAIVKSLEMVSCPLEEIIVTATNKKLYRSLRRKIKRCKKKIILLGYVNNINELMSVSDIIITKPGGVTTAEVLSNNLPMVIVKPLPGQEMHNTDYLMEKGSAIKVNNPKDTHLAIEDLLNKPQKLKTMRECSRYIAKPEAALDIAKLLLGLPHA
ncbi:MAG: glycosyltransferase [Candidatus Omnitrophota bacterium]